MSGTGSPRVLLVAAHPDDETLGAGVLLSRLADVHVLHVTDGAPLDQTWWGDPTQPTREAYARLRAAELRAAMACAGIGGERLHSLGVIDQQASRQLAVITLAIRDCILTLRPDVVLTHPYEGGHPDHDACAFAVHAAVRQLDPDDLGEARATSGRSGSRKNASISSPLPRIGEFTSYHAGEDGTVAVGRFLDASRATPPRALAPRVTSSRRNGAGPPSFQRDVARRGVNRDPESIETPFDQEVVILPSARETTIKRRMLDCYASQRVTLSGFGSGVERLRPAPVYDFTHPPHPGRLHYEHFDWGVDGFAWRELARDALAALGLRQTRIMESIQPR